MSELKAKRQTMTTKYYMLAFTTIHTLYIYIFFKRSGVSIPWGYFKCNF